MTILPGTVPGVSGRSDYVFGDTEPAARRLALVAERWRSPSAVFLRDDVPKQPRLALDLGCGPGHTTRLVATITGATRTVGLDSSESFIARARADEPPGVAFVEHDLMELPFPTGRANLAYARFVLSHIPRPDRVVRAWMTQLELGGVLALDEVEWIRTSDPVLRRYLTMLAALIEARGTSLAAGPIVDKFDGGRDGRKRTSVVRVHPVPVPLAAELFALNFATWREDPFVRDRHGRGDLDDLEGALGQLVKGPRGPTITWGMRQVTFERSG